MDATLVFEEVLQVANTPPVLAIGEVLWDALPNGIFLGGAPLNVAYHLSQLNRKVQILSRVGDDELGREALRRIADRGLPIDGIQRDSEWPTGFVQVSLDSAGSPSFNILQPSAWDYIRLGDDAKSTAHDAAAVVFGTLAQRSPRSCETIRELARAASYAAVDINLRPPFVSAEVVSTSLELAHLAKLSDSELVVLRDWFGFTGDDQSAVRQLAATFGVQSVCLTRGAHGACLLHGGLWHSVPGHRIVVADAVGAGDAFFACLLHSLLHGVAGEHALQLANAMGAYVASRHGATPPLDCDALLPFLQPSHH